MTAALAARPPLTVTDWATVEAAGRGDQDAFAEIYGRYHDQVYRYIRGRIRDPHMAEDLAADVFVKAWRGISGVEYRGRDIGAWLMTIAQTRLCDHFRSAWNRRHVVTDGWATENLDSVFDRVDETAEGRPADTVADYLTGVALMTAVTGLTAKQRECIVLRFLRGLSVAETAQAMSNNEGTVKSLTARATRSLAIAMEAYA